MGTITFDSLKFVDHLEQAGMSRVQATAEAQALRDALEEAKLASAGNVGELRHELREMKAEIVGELKLSRWMLGLILGVGLTLLYKAF